MERRWTLLATLVAAVLALGFLAGFVTAPRHRPPAPLAAAPKPSRSATVKTAPISSGPPSPPSSAGSATATTPPPTAAPAADATPDAAVADFYRLVQQHQFDAAVQLWSPRMQAAYPPGVNVYQRFADTTSLSLLRDQVSPAGDGAAVVSIDLVEVRGGQTHRWTGNWYLVRPSTTWLLDLPALRPA
jgi:hypothetical protein